MENLLDNIVWHTLSGPHLPFAMGNAGVRRYVEGFPAFVGFADRTNPDFIGLATLVNPGEQVYYDGLATISLPQAWSVEAECSIQKMLWNASMPPPDESLHTRHPGPSDATAAMQLVDLTRPGPFSPRSLELGEYIGVYNGPHLFAMAGARHCAGGYREISGVCTHPDFQGQGWARRLVLALIRRNMQAQQKIFLRVLLEHEQLHRLYLGMGFDDYAVSLARTIKYAP